MKTPILIFFMLGLLLPPSVSATNTTWNLANDFTFSEVEIGPDYIKLGDQKLNATPTSNTHAKVTLLNYTSAIIRFDTNTTITLEIKDEGANSAFNIVNGETYLLYENESSAINNTLAVNNTINFTMVAGQGYYIQAGADNNNPPPSGGGGGGGSPKVTAFKERLNVITNETMANVIKELKLESKQFCRMERGMASVFAVTGDITGEYPAPENDISGVLREPLVNIDGDTYETSAREVLRAWTSSDTVVIARGDLEMDSMAAIAYAKVKNVPILLTKPQELPSDTLAAVNELGARDFVIIGGENAVGSAVESKLAGLGSVKRIAGATRDETAVLVAKALGDIDTIIIADGERPSLDTAIIAAGYNAPILYVTGDVVPESTGDFVKSHKKTNRGVDVKLVFADVSGYIINHRLDEDF